jgi:replicative DNA helicase
VDYLQLLSPSTTKNDNREREVANLSRSLKNMSQDHNMVVIQLSQLRDRAVDTAPSGETCMRESRAIYQDSDLVVYIHQVTNEKELQRAFNVTDFKNQNCEFEDMLATIQDYEDNKFTKFVYVNVDKNRDGETGGRYYWFNGQKMLYVEA